MKIPTVELTLSNIMTNETLTIILPDENLDYQLMEICSPLSDFQRNVRVVKCSSLWGYQAKAKEYIYGLNELLLKIENLDTQEQEKVYDLFSVQKKKGYIDLYNAYLTQTHYDVIGENAYCSDREKRLRAGALYLLALCPDIAIIADGEGLMCDEYRQSLFYAGLRAGAILPIDGKFYVQDCVLQQQPTNIDLDFWEMDYVHKGVRYDE